MWDNSMFPFLTNCDIGWYYHFVCIMAVRGSGDTCYSRNYHRRGFCYLARGVCVWTDFEKVA